MNGGTSSRRHLLVGITGTPASGKSTFASSLSKATGMRKIEINAVLGGSSSLYRRSKAGERVAKLKPLERRLRSLTAGTDAILVGHLAQELDLPYDCMIVVRAGIRTLADRMRARGYNLPKTRENLACEALDCCAPAGARRCGDVFEVETDREKAAMVRAVVLGSWRTGLRPLRRRKNKMPQFAAFIRKNRGMGL